MNGASTLPASRSPIGWHRCAAASSPGSSPRRTERRLTGTALCFARTSCRPSRCSLLYAKEVPHRDGEPLGDTVFANTIAAYEALPVSMKRRIEGLKAIHRYSARRRIADSPRPKLTAEQLAETPDIAHPIVRTHPYTGRKSLYVTAGECAGIEGMPEDEAIDLIAELDAHCVRSEFLYRHKWQVGDLLMWHNATSMHLAICDYALPQRRLMHRTTVIGTVPF